MDGGFGFECIDDWIIDILNIYPIVYIRYKYA